MKLYYRTPHTGNEFRVMDEATDELIAVFYSQDAAVKYVKENNEPAIQLNETQYNLLVDEIYNSIMGLEIACSCEETASFGMGEMGEVLNQAKLIIDTWAEKANITIDF